MCRCTFTTVTTQHDCTFAHQYDVTQLLHISIEHSFTSEITRTSEIHTTNKNKPNYTPRNSRNKTIRRAHNTKMLVVRTPLTPTNTLELYAKIPTSRNDARPFAWNVSNDLHVTRNSNSYRSAKTAALRFARLGVCAIPSFRGARARSRRTASTTVVLVYTTYRACKHARNSRDYNKVNDGSSKL